MLSQHYRFHGHGSLRYVYKNGDSIRGRIISLKYTPNKFRTQPRFSVVVSKKVLKSAVGRNRIRRRVYEILRSQLPFITGGHDIVVLVFSSEVIHMTHHELSALLLDQLKQADIIHPTGVKSAIIADDNKGDVS